MAKKVFKVFLFLFILAALCLSAYLGIKYFFNSEIYQKRPDFETGSVLEKLQKEHKENIFTPDENIKQRPYSILLMGLDSDKMDYGRSDTLMVAFVDPQNKKVHLLSIPRDTRVNIPTKGMDKITHAHNYGINTSIMAVEDFLDVQIDYYAKVNFNGFQDLVDTIGGVTINVEKDMRFYDRITHTNFTLTQGEQKLTGIQALNYARFRGDGEGDFGRNRRQQQVVKAIIDESLQFRNITKINQIMKDLGDNVQTDMDFDVLTKTMTKMKTVSSDNVISIPMNAYPSNIGGISYVEVNEESLQNIKTYITEILKGNNPAPLTK